MTLEILLITGQKSKKVRMFLDSKSQKSYALKSIAEELELHPISSKTADHTLFGGTQMSAESQIPNTDKCCRLTSAEQVAL